MTTTTSNTPHVANGGHVLSLCLLNLLQTEILCGKCVPEGISLPVTELTATGIEVTQQQKLSACYVCLFAFRFEKLKAKDADFEVRYAHLGNLGVRNGVVTEFNWDSNLDDSNTEQQKQQSQHQQH